MDDDPEDAYLAQVASSDIYLGSLARATETTQVRLQRHPCRIRRVDEARLRFSIWNSDGDLDGRQRRLPRRSEGVPHHRQLQLTRTISHSGSRDG